MGCRMSREAEEPLTVVKSSRWPPRFKGKSYGKITICTYNCLRRNCKFEDNLSYVDEKWRDWNHRQKILFSQFRTINADVLCLQGVEMSTFKEISKYLDGLGYGYAHAGKGRKNDYMKPVLFFKRNVFTLRWFSSKSVTVMVELQVIKTGHIILVANCNLSLQSHAARFQILRSLLKKLDKRRDETNNPDSLQRSPPSSLASSRRQSYHKRRLSKSKQSRNFDIKKLEGLNSPTSDDPPDMKDPKFNDSSRRGSLSQSRRRSNPLVRNLDLKTAEMLWQRITQRERLKAENDEKYNESIHVPHAPLCIICGSFYSAIGDPEYTLINQGKYSMHQWNNKNFGGYPVKCDYTSHNIGPLHDAIKSQDSKERLVPFTSQMESKDSKSKIKENKDFIFYTNQHERPVRPASLVHHSFLQDSLGTLQPGFSKTASFDGKPAFPYFVVIDIEATCQSSQTADFKKEIIEFSAVLLDSMNRKIIDKLQLYVKPTVNPKLSQFCTELTGIEQKDVDNAPTLKVALVTVHQWLQKHKLVASEYDNYCKSINTVEEKIGEDWRGEKFAFVCDGGRDPKAFVHFECLDKDITRPWYYDRWVNVVTHFDEATLKNSSSMRTMLEYFKMSFEGKAHSAIDDAKNLARCTIRMLDEGHPLWLNDAVKKKTPVPEEEPDVKMLRDYRPRLRLRAIRQHFSSSQLKLCKQTGIPNEWHPSNHIPVVALFHLPRISGTSL
mmetsp:Transcript_16065/g.24211  ORF Transcript_16065/g.24211 Transcript_16065/m.24211 type:complete len:723 (-) Transcript_16065:46-2214(-)